MYTITKALYDPKNLYLILEGENIPKQAFPNVMEEDWGSVKGPNGEWALDWQIFDVLDGEGDEPEWRLQFVTLEQSPDPKYLQCTSDYRSIDVDVVHFKELDDE